MERRDPGSITVLVFKDNFASRTFQIPLAWVSRLGLIIGALTAVSLLTAATAFRFYWLARKADPVRVMDLEQELADLREALARKTLLSAVPNSTPIPLASTVAASNGNGSPESSTPLAGTGSITVPPIAQAPPAAPAKPAQPATTPPLLPLAPPAAPASGTALLGGDLINETAPAPNSLSFKIDQLHAHWRKEGGLEVNFNLLYVQTDGGSQRGRVVVLARGPALAQGYPSGTISNSTGKLEVRPREGEYFSVGRYREVAADFPEIKAKTATTTIEIVIYDTSLKVLFHRIAPLSEILR